LAYDGSGSMTSENIWIIQLFSKNNFLI
jgi:hypothetical protein